MMPPAVKERTRQSPPPVLARAWRSSGAVAQTNAAGAFSLVDTTHVVRDATAPTGVALVQVDHSGEKQILAIPGANARLTSDDVRAAAPTISGAKLLLVQLEVPLEAVRAAIQLARDAGLKVLLDPAPPIPLPDDLLAQIDFLK